MPDSDIAFTISIPISEENADSVLNAFIGAKLFNTSYSSTITDAAGNIINNPITPQMYVEDCVGYYIMDITKNYLITKASGDAKNIASNSAHEIIENLRNYINANS